jgi:hypothetical protein
MENNNVLLTSQERISEFKAVYESFLSEYLTFKEKTKKVSAYKARKALLNLTKLAKAIRKDIQDDLSALKTKK